VSRELIERLRTGKESENLRAVRESLLREAADALEAAQREINAWHRRELLAPIPEDQAVLDAAEEIGLRVPVYESEVDRGHVMVAMSLFMALREAIDARRDARAPKPRFFTQGSHIFERFPVHSEDRIEWGYATDPQRAERIAAALNASITPARPGSSAPDPSR